MDYMDYLSIYIHILLGYYRHHNCWYWYYVWYCEIISNMNKYDACLYHLC